MYQHINNLTRSQKRLLFLLVDALLVPMALLLALALRFGVYFPAAEVTQAWPLFPLLLAASILLSMRLRMHRIKLHALEARGLLTIALYAVIMAVLAMALCYVLNIETSRSVPLIFGLVLFCGSAFVRFGGLWGLSWLAERHSPKIPVAIYGAGSAGLQLVSALRQSKEVRPILFVDDNTTLQGLNVAGLEVYPPSQLPFLVKRHEIKRILMATPSASQQRQREILRKLERLDCEVQALPSYVEMIEGKGMVESLRPVSPNDLLGRDKVDLDVPGVAEAYRGKNMLVSGAGGSIGSELCRQILSCHPSKLVLLENSEFALYQIEQELRQLAGAANVRLIPILGSVCDSAHMTRLLMQHDIQIVLHAAAYKHVPLVEENELQGLYNNVIGTRTLAMAALKAEVERFILISTDKAVRPTNIMGGSKRLAELVVQDLASRAEKTLFSMVRFGNVLGSSGSVIPLFSKQIAAGGPITITHPEVTRYFMTIPESARLVLLAGSFAQGGDVFVLDMGKSVRIIDLARRMIEMSGLSERNEETPDGDIAIEITGLRPGEKLYEELLIGEDQLPTPHPKILRAKEESLSEGGTADMLQNLVKAMESGDRLAGRNLVERWVSGYHQSEIFKPAKISSPTENRLHST